MSDDPRDAARAKVRRFVTSYVAKGPYALYPEPDVVANVIEGLAENLFTHGRMYCPCADVEDSRKRGAEMVCPCTPHDADIARQGYCDCALFASRSFVAAEALARKKPAG